MNAYLACDRYFQPYESRPELAFLFWSDTVIISVKPIRTVIYSLNFKKTFRRARIGFLMFGSIVFGTCHVICFLYIAVSVIKNHPHAGLVNNYKTVISVGNEFLRVFRHLSCNYRKDASRILWWVTASIKVGRYRWAVFKMIIRIPWSRSRLPHRCVCLLAFWNHNSCGVLWRLLMVTVVAGASCNPNK